MPANVACWLVSSRTGEFPRRLDEGAGATALCPRAGVFDVPSPTPGIVASTSAAFTRLSPRTVSRRLAERDDGGAAAVPPRRSAARADSTTCGAGRCGIGDDPGGGGATAGNEGVEIDRPDAGGSPDDRGDAAGGGAERLGGGTADGRGVLGGGGGADACGPGPDGGAPDRRGGGPGGGRREGSPVLTAGGVGVRFDAACGG